MLKDHNSKIEKRLLNFGTVEIVIDDGSGEERTITRRYTKSNDEPNINFPVLFLSQNEIINIAENDEEQIRFIDRFLDFNSYIAQIRILESELSQLDIQFAESIDAMYNVSILEADLSGLTKELEPLNKKLENKKYDEYLKVEMADSAIKSQLNNANRMLNLINDFISSADDFSVVEIDNKVSEEPIIKRNQESLDIAFSKTKRVFTGFKKSSIVFNR